MEPEYNFTNSYKSWLPEEDEQLNTLYNIDMLDIIEISNIHNRAPGGIISRLIKHNYIPDRFSARGYIDYKNSDLYKSKVISSKKKKNNKYIDSLSLSISKNHYIEVKTDIKYIKNEIMEMKNAIKEITEMIKAIYEFEDG